MNKDIFQRDIEGQIINPSDSDFFKMKEAIYNSQKIIAELNNSYYNQQEVQQIFAKLTNSQIDKTFELLPPFYTDFGRNIKIGKNVFINTGCTFMDRGGITIEDNVLIGPNVNLITINHPLEPSKRTSTYSKPILIKKNVWIGLGATILPNITIGENSIVGAGSVVTKDVPGNVIVGGNPAKIIKKIQ